MRIPPARSVLVPFALLLAAACTTAETVVDYAYYASVDDLRQAADLVVVGTLGTSHEEEYGSEPVELIRLDVTRPVAGEVTPGAEIDVVAQDPMATDEEFVPLAEGDTVLLFLEAVEPGGLYAVLGGPQGQFAPDGDDSFTSVSGRPELTVNTAEL